MKATLLKRVIRCEKYYFLFLQRNEVYHFINDFDYS